MGWAANQPVTHIHAADRHLHTDQSPHYNKGHHTDGNNAQLTSQNVVFGTP